MSKREREMKDKKSYFCDVNTAFVMMILSLVCLFIFKHIKIQLNI